MERAPSLLLSALTRSTLALTSMMALHFLPAVRSHTRTARMQNNEHISTALPTAREAGVAQRQSFIRLTCRVIAPAPRDDAIPGQSHAVDDVRVSLGGGSPGKGGAGEGRRRVAAAG